jgi:hypothetical protein
MVTQDEIEYVRDCLIIQGDKIKALEVLVEKQKINQGRSLFFIAIALILLSLKI